MTTIERYLSTNSWPKQRLSTCAVYAYQCCLCTSLRSARTPLKAAHNAGTSGHVGQSQDRKRVLKVSRRAMPVDVVRIHGLSALPPTVAGLVCPTTTEILRRTYTMRSQDLFKIDAAILLAGDHIAGSMVACSDRVNSQTQTTASAQDMGLRSLNHWVMLGRVVRPRLVDRWLQIWCHCPRQGPRIWTSTATGQRFLAKLLR